MTSDFALDRKREYELRFGPYNDDDFRSPAQCPEDRRALVAQIKVSAAALPLFAHLGDYATGHFPLPVTEELEPLFQRIIDWDPHLPRDT